MSTDTTGSMAATDALRGLAVLAVLVNHYANRNLGGDVTGLANAMLALFYLCSGYGCFLSLERRCAGSMDSRVAARFYWDRASRILPLFWLAWLLQKLLIADDGLGPLSLLSLGGFSGAGHYWFISTLLQCYAAAPLLYLGVRTYRRSFTAALIVAIGCAHVLYMLPALHGALRPWAAFVPLAYRRVLLYHLVFYALGMAAAHHTEPPKAESVSGFTFGLGLTGAVCLVGLFKVWPLAAPGSAPAAWVFNVAASLTMVPVFLVALRRRKAPLWLIRIGRLSYPLYLFHVTLLILIDQVARFPENSLVEALVFLALLPPFVLFCGAVQAVESFLRAICSNPGNRRSLHTP